MSASNRAMVQHLFNVGVNNHDLSVVKELLADCIFHMPLVGDLRGEALSQFWASTMTAFPDVQRTVEEQFSDEVHVVSRWTATGAHQGHFMGVAPTGKRVTITGICIHRICDGKIVEEWEQWDSLWLDATTRCHAHNQVGNELGNSSDNRIKFSPNTKCSTKEQTDHTSR